MLFFANPLFLLGVGAAGVPVLIHLFFRRRRRVIPFPSLMLLRAVEARPSSHRRLREILLLALRAAALALAALACAKPVAGRLASLVPGGSADRILVVDNSASMGGRGGPASPLAEARRAAAAIVGASSRGDRLGLLWTAPGTASREVALGGSGRGDPRAEILSALAAGEASDGGAGLAARAGEALDRLRGSPAAEREVFVLSDFQGAPDARALASLAPRAEAARARVLFCELGGSRPRANLSVAAIEAGPGAPVAGRPLPVSVRVENRGRGERVASVALEAAGLAPRVEPLAVPPAGSAAASFLVSPPSAGLFRLRARIDPDDLAFDDARETAVLVRERIPAGLLEGGSAAALRHVRLALDPTGDGALSGVQPAPARPGELGGAGAPVAVLGPASAALDPAWQGPIRQFAAGGGVVFLWVSGADRLAAGGFLPAAAAGGAAIPKGGVGLVAARRDHPLVAGLAGAGGSVDLSSIRVRAAAILRPEPGCEALLSFSDASPALVERRIGEGRVLLLAFPPDPASSNLPLKPAFVGLLHGAVRLAASFTFTTVPCGRPVALGPAPAGTAATEVAAPGGARIAASRVSGRLEFSRTGRAGVYRVESLAGARGREAAFVAEADRAEGELAFPGAPAYASAFGRGAISVPAGADPAAAAAAARTGSDLFGAALFAAFALYLLETALSNGLARRRSPPATVRPVLGPGPRAPSPRPR